MMFVYALMKTIYVPFQIPQSNCQSPTQPQKELGVTRSLVGIHPQPSLVQRTFKPKKKCMKNIIETKKSRSDYIQN